MTDLAREVIIEACCEAIRLWEFGNQNVTNPAFARSDEQLLEYFGGPWIDLQRRSKAISYDTQEIKALIHTCEIQKVLIHKPKLEECSKYLNRPSLINYVDKSLKHSPTARWSYGIKFTQQLSKRLSLVGGDQPALASRLLFFAVPQASIFNYSAPLINKLKRMHRLKVISFEEAGKIMADLYVQNYKELSELPRPKFPAKLNKAIKQGGWWERRVLDLAILNHMH